MWVIFIVSGMGIALLTIGIILIGNMAYISMKRHNKKYDIENEIYEGTQKEIKKQIKGEKEHER